MRAAVTGAGGMLGHALLPKLQDEGHEVLALTKAEADVTHLEDVRRVFARFRPDWAFHLAAFTRVGECESRETHAMLVNGEGAGNVALAAAEVGAAVMMISTDYVFDGKVEPPYRYRESDPTHPLNVYGRSKLEGEERTRVANRRHVIVRTAWLYGDGGRNFPDAIRQQAREGKRLRVVMDQTGSPTWTQDLAPALLRLARENVYGTFHCTSSEECSWYDFAVYVVSGLDVSVEPIATGELEHPAVQRPVRSVLDNSLYEQVTKHRMPKWQDGWDRYMLSLAPRERSHFGP